MIALIMTLIYVIGAVETYRRMAMVWHNKMLNGHEFQSICTQCECKNCGDSKTYHPRGSKYSFSGCDNFEPKFHMHWMPAIASIPISLVAWWAVVGYYYTNAFMVKHGLSTPQFYKAPKPIETKEQREIRVANEKNERQAERIRELEAAEDDLKAANEKLKELGIT